MVKAKRSTKRRSRSFGSLGWILALLFATILGISLAQWQPSWFNPVLPHRPAPKGRRFLLASDRLFLPVTATLRPETLPLLDEIAANFPADPSAHIRIVSYARSGQESLNLSYRRALAIETYLKQKTGTDRYYWFASGVYSNEVKDDRVEVIVSNSNKP